MKFVEPPRTLAMGGDGNGLYPHGDEKGRSYSHCLWRLSVWPDFVAGCWFSQ
jgi:hypothetical protein